MQALEIRRTIIDGNLEITVHARGRRSQDLTEQGYNSKTRVYVAASNHPDYIQAQAHYNEQIPGVTEDQAIKKVNRVYSKVSRSLAQKAVEALMEESLLRSYVETLEYTFDRAAGCQCLCSPGVVLNTRLRMEGHTRVDIWVDVKVLEPQS